MAAIFGGIGTNKVWSPTRHKAVIVTERAQTTNQRINKPQAIVAPGHLMNVNIASDMGVAW